MKRLFFVVLFFTSLYAHHPAINYAHIQQWCHEAEGISDADRALFITYVQNFKKLIDCYLQNPQCFQTSEGHDLQRTIDGEIEQILKNDSLRPLYEKFTMLIKEEVGQDQLSAERKKEYELLSHVLAGCLACL